jgi:hypothetical protein
LDRMSEVAPTLDFARPLVNRKLLRRNQAQVTNS